MKFNHLITTALLAIAAVAAPVAHAALTYTTGNLYLGFGQASGNTQDFAVNIGAAGTYRDALAPITLTLGNLDTTLKSIFGNNYATDATVKWSIFGTTNTIAGGGDLVKTIYMSEPVGSNPPISATNQTSPAANINNLVSYYSNGANGGATSGLTESTVSNGSIGNSSNANSFTKRDLNGTPFGSSNLNPANGSITGNLEFYRMTQGTNTASDEGTFSISGDTLTFTPTTAVPEPSTYAFMFLGTVGFAFIAVRYFRTIRA